jgi:hypothetical protein
MSILLFSSGVLEVLVKGDFLGEKTIGAVSCWNHLKTALSCYGSYSYAGITQIRFKGYDLRPLAPPPVFKLSPLIN